jgi:uncharacterized protein (TIGR00369 family)
MFGAHSLQDIIEKLIPFHRTLGFKLLKAEKGEASILIPFREDLVGDPRTHRIHGGVISTAMDSVGGAAAMTTLSSDEDQLATIDLRIDFLHPGRPEDIVVDAKIVRNGKSVIFTDMKAHHKASMELIAEGRGVYRVKRKSESEE